MRVLIADDHPIVLDGIEALLTSAGHQISARCTDGDQVLRAIAEETPDVVILDVQMPGATGLDILRHVKDRKLPIRVIVLSSSINSTQALEAVQLGVDGLILKEAAGQDLLECLRQVAAGQQWIHPSAARLALGAALNPVPVREPDSPLTPREMEIVQYTVRGHRNKDIARTLGVSEATVKMHLHRVYEKLGIENRSQLGAVARERNWV